MTFLDTIKAEHDFISKFDILLCYFVLHCFHLLPLIHDRVVGAAV